MRGYSRLRYPAFFAEDGQIFLSQARNLGLAAIIEPYAGYLHVIPRIIAALLKPFPVDVAPLLYAIAALMAHLAMLTPSLSSRINWIIPGSTRRAVLFLLLCLIPPAWEVLGNIANLIFIGPLMPNPATPAISAGLRHPLRGSSEMTNNNSVMPREHL